MADCSQAGSGRHSMDKSITLPPDEIFRNLENAKRFAIDIGTSLRGGLALLFLLRVVILPTCSCCLYYAEKGRCSVEARTRWHAPKRQSHRFDMICLKMVLLSASYMSFQKSAGSEIGIEAKSARAVRAEPMTYLFIWRPVCFYFAPRSVMLCHTVHHKPF